MILLRMENDFDTFNTEERTIIDIREKQAMKVMNKNLEEKVFIPELAKNIGLYRRLRTCSINLN